MTLADDLRQAAPPYVSAFFREGEWDRLLARVEKMEEECLRWKGGRDWQYAMAIGWRKRAIAAEALITALERECSEQTAP